MINNTHSGEIWELLDRVPSSLLVVSNMCFLSNVDGRSLMYLSNYRKFGVI